jgi:hypothetical protein
MESKILKNESSAITNNTIPIPIREHPAKLPSELNGEQDIKE